ncbi:AAA family ATPase [Aphanothece sacrum]|uniref:Endonuclease GajA/Old nuclease/RecF-like AAA domain-containing protein n=1 Tax=Aphanothece sacrum FPU1 TaxID=1920663 RepID=A0A401IGF8_APHSA|nr:AAA family ATPase [Aphanothece sacrum]GBF80377.1 hypothetical protein AsFPU1_1778 [Aphanothece sacrum FPU1]GBF84916.1 hypothetical protein AsFPU3_1971 [Aphanothece sacrum FPU3]
MIKDIEIENFRCFEHTKIEGFERVNLIGGKNNSGKTALLEAILLNQSPQSKTIFLLRQLRRESEDFSKASPKKTWDNFFLNNQTEKIVKIITKSLDNNTQAISFSVTKEINLYELLELFKTGNLNFEKITPRNFDEKNISSLLFDKDTGSKLIINIQKKNSLGEVINIKGSDIQLISTDTGIFYTKHSKNSPKINDLITSSLSMSSDMLAQEYDKADVENRSSIILDCLKIIDSSLETMKTFSIGQPQLYLKRKNENYLPISLFGDAINRIVEIILCFINNKSSPLLIDEIENGIHYTNHKDFWKALFELSKELNVQIFATTHSLEMIKAFRDIGLKYYPDSGAYFEMARHYKTGQIIGIKRDLETLDYAIEHAKGVRGE